MPLKLYKRGDTYWISGTVKGIGVDGKKQSVSIRKSAQTTDRTVAEATRAKTESRILDEIAHGKAKVISFREAAESYLEAGGSGRFLLDIHADDTETGLMVHFGDTRLADINQKILDEAAAKLYPNTQPETRNRQCYTPFIAVWNHAVKNGWATVRMWQRPRKVKGTNVVRTSKRRAGTFPVEYEHAAKFIAAMSPGPAMLMTTLFYTGMRPIELFALTAGEVNVDGRWITLTHTKTGEPRGIPIHEFIVPILRSLLKRNALADDPRLFRTPRGEPYEAVEDGGGGLKSAINGARRRSGIKDVAPYTGRHSCSTGLVVAGVHPHIKDQILGHAADDMSRHYTNVPQAPLIEAINKLPVPETWRRLGWLEDPLAWAGRLAEGTGRRTDLEKKRDAR
ncbi:site-specific integrase [Sinorhizobium sp. BJ1]|uniref:tyrosine-type recombinase/integrase n=1 Tax=Sinorhizobium sp. BJ1 TaxID=2035455 RepID=UPI000BEA71CC|nr:site-specific integrase [Sinorhizobium sp. BJ1]PDT86520.1 integrase [Sinorhizobium sp. BJ1]